MAGEEFGGWERGGFSARRCVCEKGCVVLTVWERRVGEEGRFATGNCVCEGVVVCKMCRKGRGEGGWKDSVQEAACVKGLWCVNYEGKGMRG